ncbi:MAG: ribokinase, partial [Streptosporangiaceae bacterium]|nr:ribokinase [Streptosporangiaceae bacterium]
MPPPRITVLGSLNMDISVTVPARAGPGETVHGSAARLQPGGKGANQAVAAARLGASVRMAGCCGDDDFGRTLRSALEAAGVDVTAVRILAGVPSGLALITVDATGENSITVAPGANGLAGPPEAAASAAAGCDALILSAEIPVPVLAAALDRARAAGVMTVLNLAPAPPDAAGLLAAGADWLIVNAPEAGAILGRPVADPAGARAAAADLAGAGGGHAVITLG